MTGVGTFDFVIVKHKPLSSKVDDFIIIEIQGNQTTGTGALVEALEDFTRGEFRKDSVYPFGLNTYDVLKRSFTQILNKGTVLEKWGHKIFWVFQEPVYRNFKTRYDLGSLQYKRTHSTIFAIYELRTGKKTFHVELVTYESSTIKHLISAFMNNPNIPSKDDFINRLKGKIEAKIGLNLRLDK